MKKQIILISSSLLVASFAFGCAPKEPSDQVISILEKVQDKGSQGRNCDNLAQDLNEYCSEIHDELAAAYISHMQKNMTELVADDSPVVPSSEALKVDTAIAKYKKFKPFYCKSSDKVNEALVKCIDPIERPDLVQTAQLNK